MGGKEVDHLVKKTHTEVLCMIVLYKSFHGFILRLRFANQLQIQVGLKMKCLCIALKGLMQQQ